LGRPWKKHPNGGHPLSGKNGVQGGWILNFRSKGSKEGGRNPRSFVLGEKAGDVVVVGGLQSGGASKRKGGDYTLGNATVTLDESRKKGVRERTSTNKRVKKFKA